MSSRLAMGFSYRAASLSLWGSRGGRCFFVDKSALSYKIRARAEDRNWRGPFAEVAELVDALGSGPSGGNTVGVRVPSSAPRFRGPEYAKRPASSPRDIS